MLKRIITILLCVAMLLSVCALAGCGDKGGKKTGITGSQSDANNDEEYFLDMPTELRGTTVKFATWIDHTKTDTAMCLEGFETTTGMDIELVQVNQADYINKLIGLIGSDQAPDVIVENGDFPRTLNVLMPLEVETTGLDVTDPFWNQDIVKLFTVGKYSYLVDGKNSSWNMAGGMTYFNKTILAENGILTPSELADQNNWNVDSMWNLMGQIKSACGFSRPGTTIAIEPWLNMYGGNQISWNTETDTFSTTIKSENVRKALDYLMKGQEAGLLKVVTNHDDDLSTGNIALQICGAYGLRKSPGWFYEMDIDDLGFEVLPKLNASDENYPYNCATRAYGISKGSKNPKGAAYFLRYFLNEAHYDINEIFKNEEAKEMYYHLRENSNYANAPFTIGVGRVTDPTYQEITMLKDLFAGTSAQVSVNLDKSYNMCEGSVASANKLVADVIAAQ